MLVSAGSWKDFRTDTTSEANRPQFVSELAGTITAGSSAGGIFATTPTSGKIYPNVSGTQLQLIGNSLGAVTPIRVELRQ